MAGTAAALAAASVSVGIARADFTETFCSGGAAAAPWQSGVGGGGTAWAEDTDACGSGGGDGFDMGTDNLPPNQSWGAALTAPAGEVFTGFSLQFSTEPLASGSETFVVLGDEQSILSEYETDNGATHSFSSGALPDVGQVWARYDCSASAGTNCNLQNYADTLDLQAVTLTIHDTGAPAITATGGSLDANGATVSGTQDVLFHATDGGSGVASATVSLGTTPVGSTTLPCQSASLTPCPAAPSGSIAANTTLVPDGTYPVILTAADASGDTTPVQVGTVTVDNAVARTTVTARAHGRRAIRTKVTFVWDPHAHLTRLLRVHFGRLPRRARVLVTCSGRHCPVHRLRTTAHRIHVLERRLRHRSFRPGDRLRVRITARGRAAESGTELIRRHATPITLPAPRRHHR